MPPKPENRLVWQRIREHLKPLHAQRIESDCTPAFPDVEFIGGTLELKYEPSWPVRPSTKLNVKSLSKNPRQRAWWKKRSSMGGNVWVLLRVEKDWLLFQGDVAADVICNATKDELFENAHTSWVGKLNGKKLCAVLRKQTY